MIWTSALLWGCGGGEPPPGTLEDLQLTSETYDLRPGRLITFVTDELAPLVEADGAGGSPERRVTFGHSLGGLLSATFWYDEPFATRAGIASPSMW